MARRRYRSDALSAAGHGEKPADPAPPEQHPLGSEPAAAQSAASDTQVPRSEYGKSDEPAQPVSGLGQQLRDMQQHYQQQQPQPQQQIDPLAAHLASIPGLTVPKFHFLYHYFSQHPDRWSAQHWELLKAAHGITTKERNIPDDSPEYFQSLNQLLQQQTAPPPHAAPAPPPMPPPVPPTMPAQTHIDIEKTESPDHERDDEPMSSHHVSAPVSRGDYGGGHTYEAEPSHRVTLTAEERELCRDNKIDETVYAAGKLKLAKQKQAKLRD
jgi:hypothetical protein